MGKTILLADDSPTIRKIVELTFSDTEIRVETLNQPSELTERMEQTRADLVLADVALRGATGYELCRRIKSSGRPVPVLLLAGTFEPLDRELADECGADGHLVKPFESHALRQKVEELLRPPVAPEPEATAAGSAGEADEAVEPVAASEAAAPEAPSPELVDAVARAVIEKLSERVVREVAWEVVPDLAAAIIRQRIQELEKDD
jgi:CheY-like chemotaxis protein